MDYLSVLKDHLAEDSAEDKPVFLNEQEVEHDANLKVDALSTEPEDAPMVSKMVTSTIDNYLGEGLFTSALVIAAAYTIYKSYYSKAGEHCTSKGEGEFFSLQKDICMDNYNIKAMGLAKKHLHRNLDGCSRATDPTKCEDHVKDRMHKYDMKILKAKTRITSNKRYLEKKK